MKRVWNGKRIVKLKALSASSANQIVDALNALLSVRIVRGGSDQVLISDSNTIIQIKR